MNPARIAVIASFVSCLVITTTLRAAEPVTAILGAFDDEVASLETRLEDGATKRVLGLSFRTGTIGGRRVVVARTGIGKVNAAMTTTLLIEHFRPSEVIFTGVAGSLNPELGPGDILLATKTVHHDRGNATADAIVLRGFPSPIDGERNPPYFDADERLLKLAARIGPDIRFERMPVGDGERDPVVRRGVVATGDVFVTAVEAKRVIRERTRADAVEMEGAAVAQVCHQLRVPLLVIRSISDNADENASRDFARFAPIAARNSIALVVALVRALEEEPCASLDQ